MSKKINWDKLFKNPIPRNVSKNSKNQYSSGKEKMQKAFVEMQKAEQIQADLNKMMPAMNQLLLIRMKNKTPLKIMRPLRYTTSVWSNEDEDDDGFYKSSSNVSIPKFVDKVKVLKPGTEIILKSLDPQLNQFIFSTSLGEEIELNYNEKMNILTQTDIYESVLNFMNTENQGESNG